MTTTDLADFLLKLCDNADATGRLIHPGQIRDAIKAAPKAEHCCGCDTEYDAHCTCNCHEVRPATPEVRAEMLAAIGALPDFALMTRTCGHKYVGNEGEFTCSLYDPHPGKHWNSLAEFAWPAKS
jgi:hypothetical protein